MQTKIKLKIVIPTLLVIILLVIGGIAVYMAKGNKDISVDYKTAEKNEAPQAALSTSVKADRSKSLEGHNLVAANDMYELYLEEKNLSIIVKDKKTGAVMRSAVESDKELQNVNDTWKGFLQSGIVVELQEDTNTMQTKLGISNAEVAVEYVDGGFKAKVDYPRQEFGFELNVLLYDDGSITAEIPEESIYENSDKNKIGNIYVYPMLGNTLLGEVPGYMFVPDGNGALIDLDDKEGRFSAGYSQRVFGSDAGIDESYVLSLLWDKYETHNDSSKILAPIYGMVHTEDKLGYLAVIESGAEQATIMATPNGAYTDYNWVASAFRKTTTYVQLTSKSGGSVTKVTDRMQYDIKVRYLFVNGDDANYTGLANKYRDYLLETGVVTKQDTAYKTRVDFLGSDVENWLLSKKDVTMTTAEQAGNILDDLANAGVTDMLSVYKGWQKGGVNSLPITSFKPGSAVGGKAAVKKLVKKAKDMGVDFYLYNDALKANPDTANTVFGTVKKVDKRLYTEETHKDVYDEFVYWTPARSLENVNSLVDSFTKNDISSMALSGVTNNIFTYTVDDTMRTRLTTEYEYNELIKAVDNKIDKLVLEEPIANYWKYADAMLDIPVAGSDYIYTDQSVPFLSIVLKGLVPMYSDYVNFEANETEFFLKLVETGIYPSFYVTYEDSADLIYTNSNDIYTSKYSTYRDRIIEYSEQLKEVESKVNDANIISHNIGADGVVTVKYSNGVTIYVNYSDKAVTVDGNKIEAMSYKVGE